MDEQKCVLYKPSSGTAEIIILLWDRLDSFGQFSCRVHVKEADERGSTIPSSVSEECVYECVVSETSAFLSIPGTAQNERKLIRNGFHCSTFSCLERYEVY